MNHLRGRAVIAGIFGAVLLLRAAALAQPAPGGAPAPALAGSEENEQDVEVRWTEAQKAFEKGVSLMKEKKWDAALAEFQRSRATYPNRSATINAVRCLRRLGRFDEALDMLGEGANLPTVSVDDRKLAQQRIDARKSFVKGLSLMKEESWDAALVEVLRSRARYPTRAATNNAAVCLHKLRRFDEALDMFESFLRDFTNIPLAERSMAQSAIAELQGLVGTLVVEAGEPGASIVVDGRNRGTLPLSGPLRVGLGSHEVRVYKEGFDPFGVTVEVTGKQPTVVRLPVLFVGGRLKVTEQYGRALDVVVDGAVVGKTPWEGPVQVGEHLVLLRGNVNPDTLPECAPSDEGASAGKRAAPRGNIELGTQPVSVPIRLREVTKLTLTAEELDTSIRIEPTPAGASVAIDSVVVGRGTWVGRLRVGAHKVEVTAEGFLPETRQLSLERRKRQVVTIELQRAGSTPGWLTPRNAAVGTAYGVGALGLGVFAVTGAMALVRSNEIKLRCGPSLCPSSEEDNLATARTLGRVATAGVVVASIGAVMGTIILFETRPGRDQRRRGTASARPQPAGGLAWSMGVEPGRLAINGRF
jgi:hypothetical protein